MLAVEFSLELLKILIAVSILYRCQLKNTSVHRSLSGIDLALQYEYGYLLPTRTYLAMAMGRQQHIYVMDITWSDTGAE